MALDPYEQLGVERGATAAEIKSAWRRKAQQMHPDKHADDPYAETRFALIRESYDILSDPARRSAYDAEGRTQRDDLPVRAQTLLEQVVAGLLTQAQKSGDLGNIDLVTALRYALARMKGDTEHERALTARVIRGYEKQLKRVRRKGKGHNLLADLIAVRLDETRSRHADLGKGAEECAAALAMLDEYEDIDVRQLSLARRILT
jgi:curved DNA-binding protein CbpA